MHLDVEGGEIIFSFVNDQMADRFGLLNGQAVRE